MKKDLLKKNRLIISCTSVLFLWYALSFVGVDGLIESWLKEGWLWIVMALSLLIPLPIAIFSYFKRHTYTDWMMLIITSSWVGIAYWGHWQWFFSQPSAAKLTRYYEFFDQWYLIGPLANRIIPDGYHLILHFLILINFTIVSGRVIKRFIPSN